MDREQYCRGRQGSPFIDTKGFQEDWAEKSLATFYLTKSITDGLQDKDLFPELTELKEEKAAEEEEEEKIDPYPIIEVCINYLYGRDCNETEMAWLSRVCDMLGRLIEQCRLTTASKHRYVGNRAVSPLHPNTAAIGERILHGLVGGGIRSEVKG